MAENTKFSGLMKGLKGAEQLAEEETVMPRPELLPQAAPAKIRKIGKTRDPEFKRLMVLVRKKTEKEAARRWEDEQPEQDFSDLVEKLLSSYVSGRISV